jgi:hypothetical protein
VSSSSHAVGGRYELLQRNLLEGSALGGIYLLLRRGSGPPLVALAGDASGPVAGAAGGGPPDGGVRAAARGAGGELLAAAALHYWVSPETVLFYLCYFMLF